jgi:hypothetical protein
MPQQCSGPGQNPTDGILGQKSARGREPTSEPVPSVRFSPLCAAKHDEGVYRLYSLT